MTILGDTIAAIATAPGRGGVAVIRVSGPQAPAVARTLTGTDGIAQEPGCRVARLYAPDTQPPVLLDTAVVLVFRAPHSYTGEDVVEFQCHGGAVTPRRVLEACFAAGARLARRGEFTQRAFLNGRLDAGQSAAVLDLIDAKTARAADAALAGLTGRRQRALRDLYDSALGLSTRLEHALDIDEGELPASVLGDLAAGVRRLREEVRATLRRLTEGHLLRRGALVVLAGPPNAGKSSLLNALLETNRAIVSDVPGTTRDVIEETLDLDGWPIRLVDTAGIRVTDDGVEAEGVRRAQALMAQADVVVELGGTEGLEGLGTLLPVTAKCDVARGPGLNVSSKTGEGLEALKRAIVARLEAKVAACDAAEAAVDTGPLVAGLRSLEAAGADDLVLAANAVRTVAERIGALVGATYSSDLLDNLFSRFCVGK